MENQKKYKSKSPEYVKKYNDAYYQKTKVKRLADIKEKVHCDVCDCYITKGRAPRHKLTKKHLSKIKVDSDEDNSDDSDDSDESDDSDDSDE